MGDGANDLRMMGIAGLSVAFRAKPVVRSQASVALNYTGLDGLLTILGKARAEALSGGCGALLSAIQPQAASLSSMCGGGSATMWRGGFDEASGSVSERAWR